MKYTEFGLIDKIRKYFSFSAEGVLGIGDDAAVISLSKPENLLITTDTIVEGKHFISEKSDFFLIGYKSLAVNLSDIAAMGGKPLFFLLTLGIPTYITDFQIDSFLEGLKVVSSEFDTYLVGGDCVGSDVFFVSITLLGKPIKRPVLRSGANVGDNIYVTGSVGDSFFGLSLLFDKIDLSFEEKDFFILRHLKPSPRIDWMEKLISRYNISSAIDISDGLLGDLIHIAEESKCGFELYLEKIPLSKEKIGASFYERELDYILKAVAGGEDYEIVFTSPDDIKIEGNIKVTKIGKIVESGYNVSFNGKKVDFDKLEKSFTHF